MLDSADTHIDTRFFQTSVWRAIWRIGLAYWSLFLVFNTVWWGMAGMDQLEAFPGKLVMVAFCIVVTLGMTWLLYRLRTLSFFYQAFICVLLAGVATPVFNALDHLIHLVSVYPEPVPIDLVYLGYSTIEFMALFFGWCCLSVALLYSFEVRDRERLLAVAREEALAAQMRALHYQVSPHFLFNTLNSVAGLIEEGATIRAGKMVLSLSTFLRTTLTLDPVQDVRLVDELALQEEYLQIERERFSDRMELAVDVPSDLGEALVPSLILQPLVENAMKHGVGATLGTVKILIHAARDAERLIVTIENDMPTEPLPGRTPGAGIGLQNVKDRIRARFGDQGLCSFGQVRPGRYRASINLPWIVS